MSSQSIVGSRGVHSLVCGQFVTNQTETDNDPRVEMVIAIVLAIDECHLRTKWGQ
jgi:hypothetical protein